MKKLLTLFLYLSLLITPLQFNLFAQEEEMDEEDIELESFDVLADQGRGYQSALIIGASRMVVPIDELVGSAFVINAQFIKDLNPRYLSDATKFVAGVEQSRFYDVWDNLVIRSNESATNLVDGFPVRGLDYVPVSLTEQIEIIKGPQGVLYGTVSAGGLINRVMKAPKFEAGGQITVEAGSYDYFSGLIDVTGPVANMENVAYRFISEIRRGGDRQDNLLTDRPEETFSGSLKFALPGGGSITTTVDYNDRQTTFADQVTAGDPTTGLFDEDYHRSFSRYTSLVTNTRNTRVAVILEKKLGPVESRISYQYNDARWDDDALFPCCANSIAPELIFARFRDEKNISNNFYYDGVMRFDIGDSVSNIVNFGFSYQDAETTHIQILNFGPDLEAEYGFHDLNDPPRRASFKHNSSNNSTGPSSLTNSDFWSLYGNWRGTFLENRVSVIGGVRFQDYNVQTINRLDPPSSLLPKDDNVTLYRGGVLVKIVPGLNAYFGFSETFSVSTGLRFIPEGSTVGGSDFLPDPGAENLEGGIHLTLWDRKLNIGATYYELSQTGRTGGGTSSFEPIVPRPDNTNKGFEFQATAEPIDGWLLTGSVTSSEITNVDGSRSADFSEFIANFWTKYTFLEGPMEGLGVGFGINHYGDKVPSTLPAGTDGAQDGYMIPAITTWDATVSYQRGNWLFQFNGRNLSDEVYVTRFGSSVLAVWVNNGRTWSLSTTYKW